MDLLFKAQTVIILLAIRINFSQSTKYTCSLDDMKLFAAEACEHIFMDNYENKRDRREIWHPKFNKNGLSEFKNQPKNSFTGEMVRVRRKDYPHGGFIRINIAHAKILTNNYSDYKIFHRKYHNKSYVNEKQSNRDKRENSDSLNAVPMHYCCTNNCRMDFFCRR